MHMRNNGRKLELQDKIASAVYMAILDIETENAEEEMKKKEYMEIINKTICNYEELKPILNEFFSRKKYIKMIER